MDLTASDFKLAHAIATFAFLGIGLLVRGFSLGRWRKQMLELPLKTIAQAKTGLGKFQGFAWPLTVGSTQDFQGKPVVATEWVIQRLSSSGKNVNWATMMQHQSCDSIAIVDESGAAVIPLNATKFELKIESVDYRFTELSDVQREKLLHTFPKLDTECFDMTDRGFRGIKAADYQICERKIVWGSPLHVCGAYLKKPQALTLPHAGALSEFIAEAKKLSASFKYKDENFIWYTPEQYHDAFASLAHLTVQKYLGALEKHVLCGEFNQESPTPLVVGIMTQEKLLDEIGAKPFWYKLGGALLLAISAATAVISML